MSQIILKVPKDPLRSNFLAEDFDKIFFHNMPNRYKFAEKNPERYVELHVLKCHVAAVKI